MTRRLLLSYLSLTLIVLAVLEVPLGVTYGTQRAPRPRDARSSATRSPSRRSPRACSRARARRPSRPCERSPAATRRHGRPGRRRRSARGRAIVDSNPIPGDTSFASRPEIAAALSGRVASGVRHSNTLDRDLLYVAVPVASAGEDPRRSADHVPDLGGRPARAPLLADARRDRRDRARRASRCSASGSRAAWRGRCAGSRRRPPRSVPVISTCARPRRGPRRCGGSRASSTRRRRSSSSCSSRSRRSSPTPRTSCARR